MSNQLNKMIVFVSRPRYTDPAQRSIRIVVSVTLKTGPTLTQHWFNVACLLGYSHTLCSDFHYKTSTGISPYHTLAVAWTAIYGSYIISDFLIVWENTNAAHFPCDMGKYSTCPMNKVIHWTSDVFSHIALKWTPFAYRLTIADIVSWLLTLSPLSPHDALKHHFTSWKQT